MQVNGTTYYYVTNLQGDVMGMVDSSGNSVATYTYDPYGKVLTATGALAEKNPLRYRGYYYDSESGLYYLQSRYYDPTTRRFVNADSYAGTGQGLLGYSMFAYCLNNPCNYKDSQGFEAIAIFGGFGAYEAFAAGIAGTNCWNVVGWVAAGALVVGILATGIIYIYDQYVDAPNNIEQASEPTQEDTQISNTASKPPRKPKKDKKHQSLKQVTKYLLKKNGLDAHMIKYEYLGNRASVSRYDLFYDVNTGIIYILTKAGEIICETIYQILTK